MNERLTDELSDLIETIVWRGLFQFFNGLFFGIGFLLAYSLFMFGVYLSYLL